jgi:hypothetical protein
MPPPPQPPPVRISMFQNVRSKRPVEDVLLGKVLSDIRTGRYREQVEKLRKLEGSAHDAAKRGLPAFTMSGTCSDRKTPLIHSGLLQVDIDDLDGELASVRQRIKSDPHVCFGFVSPGGKGLKLGLCIHGGHHAESAKAAEVYFDKTYRILIDKAVKDPLRLCFVSYDPQLWVNRYPRILPCEFTETAESTEDVSDERVCVSVSVNSAESVSVNLESVSVNSVEGAVRISLPSAPRRNDSSLFKLARALLNVPGLSPAERLKAFALWYEQTKALGFLRHDRKEYLLEFMRKLELAKHPLGESPVDAAWRKAQAEPLPALAEMFEEDIPRKLMALCVQMHRASGDGKWFLSCRTLGKLVGASHSACAKWLDGFVGLKILECVERGTKHRAARYRLVPTEQPQ